MTSVVGQPSIVPTGSAVGAMTPDDPFAMNWDDRAARRGGIVRSLARYLASETARELAGLSAPPVIEVSHDYEGTPVLEGSVIEARVVVHDYHRGHIQATVLVPGESTPRPFVPDQPVTFPATRTGPILVSAKNVLNPRTVSVTSPSIHVAEMPRVNPFTFTGVEIRGLSGAQIAELARAMTGARADGLELDPWFASDRIRELPEDDRAAAEFSAIDELLIAMSQQVSDGSGLWRDVEFGAGMAASVSVDSGPSLLELRSQVGAHVLLDAAAQVAVALALDSGSNGDPPDSTSVGCHKRSAGHV